MYGRDILCGISKVPFEIPHKISCPYIERYVFYSRVEIQALLDLRAHTRFWNAPQNIHFPVKGIYGLCMFCPRTHRTNTVLSIHHHLLAMHEILLIDLKYIDVCRDSKALLSRQR